MIFSGCSAPKGIKGQKIITGCICENTDGQNYYTFLTSSVANGENNDEKQSGFKSYTVVGDDFFSASEKLKKEYAAYDLHHLSALIFNENYVKLSLKNDLEYMLKKIKPSPLIKTFVTSQDAKTVVSSISETFNGGMDEYVKTTYINERKNILCTLTEIVFSYEVSDYTSSIPVLSQNEYGGVTADGIMFLNFEKEALKISDNDFKIYENFVLRYGKTSDGFNYKPKDNKLYVKAKNKNQKEILSLAQKYKNQNFDILNSLYFSKKKFLTLSSHSEFFEKYGIQNIIYQGE